MSSQTIKLEKKYILRGELKTISGLHIGGSDSGVSIGSPDSIVIKHPISLQPYIPGSSLKGKLRSLIELRDGTIGKTKMGAVENGPSEDPTKLPGKLFGTSKDKKENGKVVATQKPSRIILRDAFLSKESLEEMNLQYTEIKTEVVIDRITSKAMPRQIERVLANSTFNFEIVLNHFKGEDDMIEEVLNALELLQDDYLGGHGSRGSGQIDIKITSLISKSKDYYDGKNRELSNELTKFKDKYSSIIIQ